MDSEQPKNGVTATTPLHPVTFPHGLREMLHTNKVLMAGELFVACALCFARIFPFSVQVLLLGFASLSLWLRGLTWLDVGLKRSRAWWKNLLWALLAAVILAVVANLLIQPLLAKLLTKIPDQARFQSIRGHLPVLFGWLCVTWTAAAFGEEMFFRGYLMNRITDLVGKTRLGWISAWLGSSLIFGLAHGYQGVAGIVSTGEVGLWLGMLYLINRRNLWVNIICHGVFDSIAMIALYYS